MSLGQFLTELAPTPLDKARDAVIRAAKAWANWKPVSGVTFDVLCRNLEKQNMLIRRLDKAVARLEKLEGK